MTYDKFVGPMPVNTFLEEFIPDAPAPCPQADFLFSRPSVSQNEDDFIEAIRGSGLCPNLFFVNTSSLHRKKRPLKPDISVFLQPPKGSEQLSEVGWGTVELWIESKRKRNDPFTQIEGLRKSAKGARWTHGTCKTCGHLIAYATALHRAQFRIFSFSVAMFEDTARLLRWDRSGVIYTEPFKWAGGNLFEFLWRFNHLSAVNRGHDMTVSSAEDDEAEMALPRLRTYPMFENLKKEHLHRILAWDDRAPSDKPRRYITPSAKWPTDALIGRATFGYIAFEVESGNLVYLKDFWRVDRHARQKEGDVYRELHDAQVPNIAEMGRAGDVPLVLDDGHLHVSSFGVQRTRTQDYVSGRDSRHSFCPGHPHVEPYVHYRLVLETVGAPLNQFKSTRQLCEVIRDAVVAHSAAYNKTRILHRDISAGNILITDNGTGILIDWDLSKKVSENADGQARQHSRTGTWKFISIGRLMDPWTRTHEVSDDLESFFWVLLYEVVRYRTDELKGAIQDVFDQQSESDQAGIVTGGKGKLFCVEEVWLSESDIECLVETPCCAIIEEMRSLFSDFYRHIGAGGLSFARSRVEEKRKHDPLVNHAREKLRSSETFLSIFEKHLQSEWDINDDGSLDLTDPKADPSGRRKRKADDTDDGEENIHVRRIGRMPPRPASDEDSSQTSLSSYNSEMLESSGVSSKESFVEG